MADFTWRVPAPGAFGIGASEHGIDPMWLWAEASGYRDHGNPPPRPQDGLWFVVENRGRIPAFASRKLSPRQLQAERLDPATLELALPVVPQRMRSRPDRRVRPAERGVQVSDAALLVGVIDSGCPFAAPSLRDASGVGTRVIGLWDQDDEPSVGTLDAFLPRGFEYGAAVDGVELNRLMARCSTPDGHVDEEHCYQEADFDAVRGRWSHGGAVISRLFGREPGRPAVAEPVDRADVVFVQAARAAVQDSTSASLARTIVDGLRFILAHVRPGVTRRVVVNISSGTSRGTHDGRSLLERAMSAFIDDERRRGVTLQIVVPIGNTNREQRHAILSDTGKPLTLTLPADSEMPQYVTIRWPDGERAARLRITPPSGPSFDLEPGRGRVFGGPASMAPVAGAFLPRAAPGDAARGLVAFAPTASDDPSRPPAPAGRWRFELVGARPQKRVLLWISRNQTNPGALPRGRQADFIDADERHSPARYLRPTFVDPEDVRNGIRRRGALSGLATLQRRDGLFVVVGGSVGGSGKPSWYSSQGPAAGGRRAAPDCLAAADASTALPGLTARGNRSGETLRVIGTSFAAPLVARALANSPVPDPAAKGRGPEATPVLPYRPVRP